ncbi:Rho GTPase activation protein [Lactarius quietus]|nr:Rho GTPase activation protein [Lactarius quietus]
MHSLLVQCAAFKSAVSEPYLQPPTSNIPHPPMSFVSVEPQSRAVLESHSYNLLAQYDAQLGNIADRYLAFFQERRSIEAIYIDSLRKLHRKAKTVDISYDPRAEPTTTRSAWDKVTDSLEREANTQQDFVDILDSDVIKPLRTMKESKDETRKRIEEDLKRSADQYADHVENKISKLQEAYMRKHHPQQYSHSTEEDVRNKGFGGKVSALFRSRREESRESEPCQEVSYECCRRAVGRLNSLRLIRAEYLGDGYDCLEEFIFTATVKDVLVKYMDGMMKVCAKYDGLAKSTGEEVQKALRRTDSSDLRASFCRALSFSIPPPTIYCHSDTYSELIFGIPLVNLTTDEDNVPKVMRMCIEEVEKRGLNTRRIYSVGSVYDAEVLELRRRFESEKTFSLSSTDNIHSVAILLKRYLWDLPEPLFMLSLEEYRNYTQNRASYTENDCSLFRSKIYEIHPAHRASLEALLRHLLRVSSHSDKNLMTVQALASQFRYAVLRGGAVVQDGVHVKARCIGLF